MSSDEDKPPAPPVRLTSNRATDRGDSVASVDMRPLPKGISICYHNCKHDDSVHIVTLKFYLLVWIFTVKL